MSRNRLAECVDDAATILRTTREESMRQNCRDLLQDSRQVQRFFLPRGGIVIDDRQLRALDETTAINLPYPITGLEYSRLSDRVLRDGEVAVTDVVIVARQHTGSTDISMTAYYQYLNHLQGGQTRWIPMPTVVLNSENFIRRGPGGVVTQEIYSSWSSIPMSDDERVQLQMDLAEEVEVLASFLNCLACSNVVAQPQQTVIRNKSARRRAENAPPAAVSSTHHVLVLKRDGRRQDCSAPGNGARGHASPREHLRRGHIRRLPDGRHIFISAVVVNPGTTGKITKDYRMQPKQHGASHSQDESHEGL